MNKKIIIGIMVVILIIVVIVLGYFLLNKKEENSTTNGAFKNTLTNDNSQNDETDRDNPTNLSNERTLVVYFSATGSTKKVAEQVAKNLKADLFEIIPKDIYTSEDLNWNNNNSRVSREHDDESLRNVSLTTTKVDNWSDYDTILIGYPIWWGNCCLASRYIC